MKLRKKRKKDKINKLNIKKSMLILIMLISIIIAMITYWIYAYNHKYGKFYFDEIKLVDYKITNYLDTKGDIVYLKNIDKSIIKDFTNKQQIIINNNKIISTEIKKELHDSILSIMISYTINGEINNYEEILTINIDLKKDKLLNNEELLERINTNYKNIAINIFDENIKLPNDSNKIIVDAITNEELTVAEFNNNREKYIIRIREKLPEIINLYIENGKVYYIVNLLEIDKVCYNTNKGNRLVNIKKEIGKI